MNLLIKNNVLLRKNNKTEKPLNDLKKERKRKL